MKEGNNDKAFNTLISNWCTQR